MKPEVIIELPSDDPLIPELMEYVDSREAMPCIMPIFGRFSAIIERLEDEGDVAVFKVINKNERNEDDVNI